MTLASLFSHRFSVPWQCPLGTHGAGLVDSDLPRATALHAAVRGGHDHIVEWILENISDVDVDCEAYLWCLCPSAHMQFSQYRQKWQPSLCATPLHVALASGAGSTAKILMSRGAVWDREFTFTAGMTGLHMMAANGMTDLINWVVDEPTARRNALHDWPDEWGRSSLHYATFAASTRTGHFEVDMFNARNLVKSLLRLGAIANTKDRERLACNIVLERNQLRRRLDCRDRLSHNSYMAWTDRFRRGLAFMGEMWSLRPTPADYALRRGNSAVALAIEEAIEEASLIRAERA
ncbi:uncharacterized protein LY79DRAFT_643012 [Colletotrichum navitas]|uniref:Ankyrin repeat protein n=1 Tax=Colletotrichum navitas TaxID=681940 RepID=A0AAD8PLH6_9PEZI|nr:uncharacterized protein LY79DRAFT_643012 [Colletotrichum navitas]KAK1569996.1 hypothetical protein LY79DRAFT_643012 [Colletotrichum navitas]